MGQKSEVAGEHSDGLTFAALSDDALNATIRELEDAVLDKKHVLGTWDQVFGRNCIEARCSLCGRAIRVWKHSGAFEDSSNLRTVKCKPKRGGLTR